MSSRFKLLSVILISLSALHLPTAFGANSTLDEAIQNAEKLGLEQIHTLFPEGAISSQATWPTGGTWDQIRDSDPSRFSDLMFRRLIGHVDNFFKIDFIFPLLVKSKVLSFHSSKEDWKKAADMRERLLRQIPRQILFRLGQYQRFQAEEDESLPLPKLSESIKKVLGENCTDLLKNDSTESSDPK
jgi:hypothetical protein